MNSNNSKSRKKEIYSIKELLDILSGEYEGFLPLKHEIIGVSTISENTSNKLTFAEDKQHLKKAEEAEGLVLVNKKANTINIENVIKVDNVRLSYAKVAKLFAPIPYYNPGTADSAVIKDDVKIGNNVSINSNTYIGFGSEIDDNVVLAPGVKIGDNVKIGKNTVIHPNVVIERDSIIGKDVIIEAQSVIGSEGYGYVTSEGKHHHIPQLGNVIIEDEVEIGACVSIDRSTQASTIIGKGTKIDNQVQIAHNVKVGKNCLIVGKCGIAGSVIIGDNVMLAGAVRVIDHVEIGDNVKIGLASVVTSDIPSDSFYLGNPAQERMKELRARAVRNKLPEYRQEFRKLKNKKE